VAPVLDPKLRQELRLILDAQLSSRRNVWEMQPDGSYLERQGVEGKESKSSQETFIALAQKRKAAATKHKQSKLREKLLIYFHKRLQSAN
jgi:polyphosphate kinase